MLIQDLRFAIRTSVKNKGVTGLAVLCLAIGIGLNTMMFSVTDGVLLQSLPYQSPDRIVVLHTTQKENNERFGAFSWLELQDWQERARSFGMLAGIQYRSFTVSEGGDADRYAGAAVGHQLFPLLGKSPTLGRGFTAEDDRPGAEPVVLISDDLWKRRYDSDPSIIGRAIQVNSRPHTVIGVMPPQFRFPENQYLWLPLSEFAISQSRGARGLEVFGRLRDGVTLEQAQREGDAVAATLAGAFPDTTKGRGIYVRQLRDWAIPDDVSLIILTMMGAVTLVLLIACSNVANLMLARASSRSREIVDPHGARRRARPDRPAAADRERDRRARRAFRSAWPARGAACSCWTCRSRPTTSRTSSTGRSTLRSLLYTIGVAALTGIVFGLAPALQATKADLQEALKEGGRGTAGGGRAWIRNTLVVAEVALSLLLLIGASLFVRSFLNLQQATGGFDTAPLMTMRFYMPDEQYAARPRRRRSGPRTSCAASKRCPASQAAFASNMIPAQQRRRRQPDHHRGAFVREGQGARDRRTSA